jgi:hypothetical protein
MQSKRHRCSDKTEFVVLANVATIYTYVLLNCLYVLYHKYERGYCK